MKMRDIINIINEAGESPMTREEAALRERLQRALAGNPWSQHSDEVGCYIPAEGTREIAAAKRMLKAGEVKKIVDASIHLEPGFEMGKKPFGRGRDLKQYQAQTFKKARVYYELSGGSED